MHSEIIKGTGNMEIASSAWGVLSAGLVFMVGTLFSIKIGRVFNISSKRSLTLYLWHTLFSMVYLALVMRTGGDALMYYQSSLGGGADFSLGTAAVRVVTGLLSTVLGLSLLGAFLAYNVFGFIGLLAFDASLTSATSGQRRYVQRLATLVIFLPSVSLWSSAIGKDSLAFMATGLALWSAQSLSRRSWTMTAAIGIMLLVRPHMAALMIAAVALSIILERRLHILQRILIGALAVILAIVMVPVVLNKSGLDDQASMADLAEYVEVRQGYNMDGGGGVDISTMSLPSKLFTYMFRPLPFEARSITTLAASIDNTVLLLLFIVGVWCIVNRRKAADGPNRAFLWIYSLSAWFVLASTTANLGISVRQKWMFAPMLIFLLISVVGKPRKGRMALRARRGFGADDEIRDAGDQGGS